MDTANTPDLESFHFYDAQEQASALTGWNQNYLQLSAGGFHGEISQLQGTGIRLFVEQVQQSVFQTGVLASDVLAVGIPLDTVGTGVFCGSTCGADSFHVFSGASGFEFRSSRQHTMLGIELKVGKAWMNHAGCNGDANSWTTRDLPAQACALTLGPSALAEVRAYLLSLFRAAKLNPCLLSTPAVMSIVADYLLDRMAQLEPGAKSLRHGPRALGRDPHRGATLPGPGCEPTHVAKRVSKGAGREPADLPQGPAVGAGAPNSQGCKLRHGSGHSLWLLALRALFTRLPNHVWRAPVRHPA
jgi:hypothetical protein